MPTMPLLLRALPPPAATATPGRRLPPARAASGSALARDFPRPTASGARPRPRPLRSSCPPPPRRAGPKWGETRRGVATIGGRGLGARPRRTRRGAWLRTHARGVSGRKRKWRWSRRRSECWVPAGRGRRVPGTGGGHGGASRSRKGWVPSPPGPWSSSALLARHGCARMGLPAESSVLREPSGRAALGCRRRWGSHRPGRCLRKEQTQHSVPWSG